ncbi:bifunctional aminoglycoside phosphotransferase/ATP-binding protein [Alsobacter sp. R-9]
MTADAHLVEDQSAVFAFLAEPATHGVPVTRIDTHGAMVVLAGPVAYKAKRAVRFPFMDYSTLAKRRAACEAEVAVNAAHAPGLYRGVVAVTREPGGALALGGAGEPVEWAVVMRRFDESMTLDRVAERGGLTPEVVSALASAVAAAHEAAPVREAGPFLDALGRWLQQNRAALAESPELFDPAAAKALGDASDSALERLAPLILARGRAGRVRRCHGDLHLRNLVLIDGVPTPFDAIEFDETVATGDVLYDLAFLLMDLVERGHAAEANVVLNRYLWLSDACDLDGLAALPLYLSVRAVIRAKVLAAGLASLPEAARLAAAGEARRYFSAARAFLAPAPARMVAVGGLSGTGKSTLAAALAPGLGCPPGAIHLRTDIERKRLFGVPHTQRLGADAYTAEASAAVYAVLRDKAARALAAGFAVVADAVHARGEEREAIARVAAAAGVPFQGLWLEAPAPVLLARVESRTGDASDADAAVVRAQADYLTGPADWPRLPAGGEAGSVLAAARALLG